MSRDVLHIMDRHEFPALLNYVGLLGTVVEVGVYEGEFAEHFRKLWKGQLYVMVDPWDHLDDYGDPANADSATCRRRLQVVRDRFSVFGPDSYKIMQNISQYAHSYFEDLSVDMVYIDANHDCDHVCDDIRWWWPKIKTGGILGGHDYTPGFGVLPAVNLFASLTQLKLRYTQEDKNPSWYVFKP